MMRFTIEELKSLAILEGLSEDIITWLSDNGTRIDLVPQDHMFTFGQQADYMFIVVQGKIERFQDIDGQSVVAATTGPGQVTGMLPFSRMTKYPGNAIAAEPTQVLRIDKKYFNKMLELSHELGQRLVAEMSNRVRGDVRLEQQWEKMVSLGKLSAGLAHELNNPIAAIRSTATTLKDKIDHQADFIMKLTRRALDPVICDAIDSFSHLSGERDRIVLSPLERSEGEEKVVEWLGKREIENSWDLAHGLTNAGLTVKDLEQLTKSVPSAVLEETLIWVCNKIEAEQMLSELNLAAGRVSELVSVVKKYSHMDRSAEHKPTRIDEGIDITLKIFEHKFKKKNIQVIKKYKKNLPTIQANAGELNQVWTYLIDNAIDALNEDGKLAIEISHSEMNLEVKIIDNGEGIPKDIIHRIFDPFFTTKDVGQGTGLGLDIARRIVQIHRGQIDVQSKPGRTEFMIRLPIVPNRN
jgi:signal transduction histidine kinase